MATAPIEDLLTKMRNDAVWGREIVAHAQNGKLHEAVEKAGFTIPAEEITKLEASLASAKFGLLSEEDLSKVTGAGEGEYFAWLDQFMEGA